MPNQPAPSSTPVPNAGFLLEELDGELLLFNPGDGRLLELNATAALVWGLCDGVRPLSEIIALLTAAYPESAAAVHADVPAILTELRAFGAVAWK